MKKIVAAILMCILLFNWFGYRFVADYMQKKSDSNLESRLDENLYDESRLIELKIPIHLAYQTSWSSFERYDGEIEINGELYKYVKRKVCYDTLYLMCIANHQKKTLQIAKNDFYKNTNDFPQNTSQKSGNSKSNSFKNLLSDYDNCTLVCSSKSTENTMLHPVPVYSVTDLPSSPRISPEQPPDSELA